MLSSNEQSKIWADLSFMSIWVISKGDKCFENQTPFQTSRSAAETEIISQFRKNKSIKTH